MTHNVITLRQFKLPLNFKFLSVIAFSFLVLNNSYALGKRINSKLSIKTLPSETCFELQKNERWDAFIERTRVPQKFCVKSAVVDKVYTNQVSVILESDDIPRLLFGDIHMSYKNGEKRISTSISRQELSQKGSDYFGFAKVDLLFTVDKNGTLISEFDIHGYVMETSDLQKSDGESTDLLFEKTVRK